MAVLPVKSTGAAKSQPRRWCSFPKLAIAFAALSQLVVFRHLYYNAWPRLLHPMEPPLSTSNNKDDSFLGQPLVYRSTTQLSSSVHCIGETFEPKTAWRFRSCQYQNLCFDLKEREYAYVQSKREAALEKALAGDADGFKTVSTVWTKEGAKVDLGGKSRRSFVPRVTPQEKVSGFYELPANAVLVVHSVGQESTTGWDFVWEELFPVFTLLSTFGLTGTRPLVMMIPDSGNDPPSNKYREILFPIMGISSIGGGDNSPQSGFILPKGNNNKPRSNLVCARQAVAGSGRIADRGRPNNVEQEEADPPHLYTHNMAQGKTLRDFRDYILRNLQVRGEDSSTDPSLVTVSLYGQQSTLVLQEEKLTAMHPNKNVRIETIMPLLETRSTLQLVARQASTTSVLVVQCCDADAALAATLLPTEASLIVLYDDQQTTTTSFWDLVTNAGYLQTYWVPSNDDDDGQALLDVLQGVLGRVR